MLKLWPGWLEPCVSNAQKAQSVAIKPEVLRLYDSREGVYFECHSYEPSLKSKWKVHVWSFAQTEQDAVDIWERSIRDLVARNEIALPEYLTNK